MERGRWIRATEASPGHPHASFLAISAAERVVPATCSYSRTRGVVPTLGIPAHQSPDVAQRQAEEGPYFRGLLGGPGDDQPRGIDSEWYEIWYESRNHA